MELRSVRLTRTHREAERANALTGRAKISYVRIMMKTNGPTQCAVWTQRREAERNEPERNEEISDALHVPC